MQLASAKIVIGLLVGLLVGLTGMGAGVLLLPVMIFGFRVPPIVAVGSDAVFNAVTKLGSGYLHYCRGSVNRSLVVALLSAAFLGLLSESPCLPSFAPTTAMASTTS